jgi:hypothetical protein
MRKIFTVLGVSVSALGLVLGLSGSSYAGSDGPTVCNSGPQSACAWFHQDGDIVYVKDTDCDRHAAVAQVQIPAAGIYENLWNTDGCGTTRSRQYGTSVPEGSRVYYQACYGVYSTGYITRCSALGSGVA